MKLTNLIMTLAAGLMLSSPIINAQTPVTVANTDTNPVQTQSVAASQPFTYTLPQWTLSGAGDVRQIPVPAGKRLVIQYVAFSGATQSTTAVTLHLTTNGLTANGSTAINNHWLLLTPQPVSQNNVMWIYSAATTIYGEGPTVSVTVGQAQLTNMALGNTQIQMTVSGYLVNQ